jgi:elongation factor G
VVPFNYTHKKQTGGSGQFGRVAGRLEPLEAGDFEFVDEVRGGAIPRNFIPSLEKGFRSMLAKGPLVGAPVVQVRVVVDDGASHTVDSSDIAFREAARGAWREAIVQAGCRILEPIMKVAVETPPEFAGGAMATLTQRRGMIIGSQEESGLSRIEADVPLGEMFGYSTTLRSASEGKAEFTMEFLRYAPVPERIKEELIEKARKRRAGQSNTDE